VDIGVRTENSADTHASNAMASTDWHANTLNGETRGRTGMAFIAVKLHSRKRNRKVVTFASLESGSSATFSTESLRNLDESGPKVEIFLPTLKRKNSPVKNFGSG